MTQGLLPVCACAAATLPMNSQRLAGNHSRLMNSIGKPGIARVSNSCVVGCADLDMALSLSGVIWE